MKKYYLVVVAVLFTAQAYMVSVVSPAGEGASGSDTTISALRWAMKGGTALEMFPPGVKTPTDTASAAAVADTLAVEEGTDETGAEISSLRTRAGKVAEIAINPAEDRKVQLYLIAASRSLLPEARNALAQIQGTSRRLVALRGYLRRGKGMKSRWTWTPQQISRYKRTSEYRRVLADVRKVQATFAELNPGYRLKVNTEVRTLEAQLGSWNVTGSVGAAGADMLSAAQKFVADTNFAEEPTKESLAKFSSFVSGYKLSRVPTLAVPGLSEHGQLRAFDFIVMQGDSIVAGTDAGSVRVVWDKAGWTEKLKQATLIVSTKFEGPLEWPREPWHYSYRP